jgi:hypothetical protein
MKDECIAEYLIDRIWRCKIVLDTVPGSLVARFFLTPDNFLGLTVSIDLSLKVIMGEWIELFQPDNCHIGHIMFASIGDEFVIYFATADNDARFFWVRVLLPFRE